MEDWVEINKHFRSWDEEELFYRCWQPAVESKKAILLLHRGHEHSGRVANLMHEIALKDYWGFSYDMRGHGLSPGERGYAENYDVWVKDLNSFVRHITSQYGIAAENVAVVANSVGAVNAVTWLHDYGVQIRCLILAAPAFRIKLYVPFAIPLLRLLHKIKKKSFVKSYVRSNLLTTDEAEAKGYDTDKLITRNIAVSVLLGLHDTATRVLADAGAITTPTMIFSAGQDFVVQNCAHEQFFQKISSTHKEHHTFKGMRHAIFYEKNREEVVRKCRDFIQACFTRPVHNKMVLESDKKGYTYQEYIRLKRPGKFTQQIGYNVQIASMKSLGLLSKGIRIGWQDGFDSGQSLDHVYQNKAQGFSPLGKIIDRCYLNAIGWQGVRTRKNDLKYWVEYAIKKLSLEGKEAHILDIACGAARYLLELKHQYNGAISLLLRDNVEANLLNVRSLAEEWQLDGVSFELEDAFNAKSYHNIRPKPNVAVVSGFYELFPDNENVLISLKGLASAMDDGGYLIYTGQPWHPQIEMIARTLINRNGEPWVMRRRTQEELNTLVAEAGFNRIDSRIDPHGIFTVTLAQKG